MKHRIPSLTRLSLPLASAIAALLAGHSASGAPYYWDNTPGVLGFGAAVGTWSATTDPALNSPVGTGWSTSSSGAAGTVIGTVTTNNTSGTVDAINFGGSSQALAAGTISVGTVSCGNITYGTTTSGIVLSGGTITLAPATTFTVNNVNNTQTIGSVLTGAATSLTHAGPGTVVLTGANTFTGPLTIRGGGRLTVNSIKDVGGVANALGQPALANATLAIGATTAAGSLSYIGTGDSTDRVINLAGTTGGVTLDQSGSGLLKFTSPLTATGVGIKTLTLQGSLSGAGEIAGAIANNTGTTTITSTFVIGATTAVLASVEGVSIGATISGTGIAGSIISDINTATKTVTFDPAATTASGAVGSSYVVTGVQNRTALTKAGSGTWTLSGANTFTGATSVNGGILNLAFGTVTTDIISPSSALTLGGGTLQLSGAGTQTLNGLITTASTSSRILLGTDETLTLGDLTAAGANSSLNLNTTAGGANATTATVGTGLVVLTGQIPDVATNSGFTVSDAGGFGLATVNASNQVVRQTTGAILLPATGATSADYRVDNNAGGAAADGSSSLTLTATADANSITVDTTAATGVLSLDSGVELNNSMWHFGGVGSNTYQITGSDGGAGLKSKGSGTAININNYNTGAVTIAAPILANGTNAVNLNGPGTTVFSGSNTYTGLTTVKAGTLKVTGGTSVIGTLSLGAAAYEQDGIDTSVTLAGTTDMNLGTAGTSSFTLKGGTFAVTGILGIAGNIGSASMMTFNQSGGLFSYTPAPASVNKVFNIGVGFTGSVTLNLSGGTFRTGSDVPVYLGGRVNTEMNISGSTTLVDIPNLFFNRRLFFAHTATLNLGDGTSGSGTLRSSAITKHEAFTIPAPNNISIFNFNGGTLQAGVSTATFFSGLTTANIKNGGAVIDTNTFDITIAQPLLHFTGATTDSLTKNGSGILTLSGANTFSGDTTVSEGTLTLSNAPNPLNANPGNDASTVTIATDAFLNLAYTGTDNVSQLIIGTTPMTSGVYGKAGSAAPIIGISQITGDGTLTVVPAFSLWIAGTFANGAIHSGQQGPTDDFDKDGISNLLEYAIAGQDPTVANPTISTFTANTLTYTKRAGASGLTYAIQESTDLGVSIPWAEVTGVPPTYVNDATIISYTLTPGTPAKNFIRLQVTQP